MKNKQQQNEVFMNKGLFKKSRHLFPYSFLFLFSLLFCFTDVSFSQSNCVEGEIKIGSQTYTSIELAVNASRSRDVISLGSGSFEENLDINNKNNLTIQSNCFAELIGNAQVRNSNNFHLKGVSIKSKESSSFALKLSDMEGAKIEDGHVSNSGGSGVWLLGNSDVIFSKLSVYKNSTGFVLENGTEALIKDSLIHGNKRDGVLLKDMLSVIIEDTDIYNNKHNGILSFQSSAISGFMGLNRTQIYSNSRYGISLQSGLSFRVSNSRINDNSLSGLRINKSASASNKDIIEDSMIDKNKVGIEFSSPQALDLLRNEIIENEGFGFLYNNPSNRNPEVFLNGNQIKGNKGSVSTGVSSKDLSFYSRYLDNTDSGNETSLNNEGLGVGNHKPIAKVEDVFFNSAGESLNLSASKSYDRDGEPLSYSWAVVKKPNSSTAVIQANDKLSAVFSPDVLGDYEIELEVSDGKQTSKDKLIVSSNNIRPKARAGLDLLVDLNDRVQLDGTASSDKGANLKYSWSFVKKPIGSSAEIKPRRAKKPRFTVDKAGDYEIELEVSDGSLTKTDRLLVSTINIPPQVDITKPSTPALAQALSLSSTVQDEDLNNKETEDRKVTYKWSVLSAPAGQDIYRFSSTNTKDTSFTASMPGVYLLQLRAFDGELLGVDTILLTYGNRAPQAKTGKNIPNAIINKIVDLDGSSSSDPEGKALTYEWSFDVKPQGSMAVIGDAKEEQAFFRPDKTGVYRIALNVSDGFQSSKNVMKVTVKEPKNRVPSLAKIGNKTVKIGEEISFELVGSDKDNGASLRYMVSPLPLPENMTFNAGTGEFFFKPRANQAGDFKLNFSVIDELGAEHSRDVTITVSPLVKGAKTSVKGRVLEANAMANSETEVVLSGIDVRLSVDGNNMYGAMTDNQGYFTINNIPKGEEYIIQIATGAITENGKAKYADFHEQIEVIQGTKNLIPRPFYMPLVDTKGMAEITANKATKLVNTAINAELEVPANVAQMNGMAYTGDISLSEVPKALAPIALPENVRGTATLLTLQPAGLRFTTPVRVTFPNRDNFPAGTELDILSVNPDTGLFEKTGKGRVNADRTKIETFEGGITAATWHAPILPECDPEKECCPLPPPPDDDDMPEDPTEGEDCKKLSKSMIQLDGLTISLSLLLPCPEPEEKPPRWYPRTTCDEPPNEDCETCESGSNVDLLSGEMREEHTLASYRSLNEDRVLTLGYSSQTAHPLKTISFDLSIPVTSAIPQTLSSQIRLRGFNEGEEVWTNTTSLPENSEVPFTTADTIDLSSFYTGIYGIEAFYTSQFLSSVFSTTRLQNFSVVNGKYSFYGSGWSVVNLHRIYPTALGDVLLVKGNGYHSQFSIADSDFNKAFVPSLPLSYESPSGDYSILERVAGGSFIRTTKNGMVYKFDKTGLLMSEEDRNGNKTSYCYYENSSRLKCIKDPNGMEYTFTYGSNNYLDTITDPQGRVTRFEHDSNGNLIKITDPDNTTREFSYNDKNLMTAQMDKRGNLTNYIYNEHHQVTQTIKQDGTGVELEPQSSFALASEEDINNKGTEANPMTVSLVENRKGIYIDANKNESEFLLSERGQFTSLKDALGRQTNIQRDIDGNQTKLTTPRNFAWNYTYDNMGNQLTKWDSEIGVQTYYTYEPNFNQITSLTRPNGDLMKYEYDDKGNLIKMILPDDSFHTFKYNKAGLMTESVNPLGNKTSYFYDRVTGNLIAQRDSLGNTINFELDKVGNIIQAKDAKGNIVKSEYDSLNRLIKNIDGEGGESFYTYDKKGNLISLKDERNNTTNYVYDLLDRMIQRTNPLNQTEYFSYDDEGYMTSHLNRLGELTTYTYDKANQLVQKVLGSENIYNYSYDSDGNIVSLSDNDSKLTYEYDALSRIIKSNTAGSLKQPTVFQSYIYDKNNNRTWLRAGSEEEKEDTSNYMTNTYIYDLENQLTSLYSYAGVFNFEYDDLSRLTKMTYPNGMRTEMSFDGDTRLSKVEHIKPGLLFDKVQSVFSYQYDNNNKKTQMKTFRRTLPVNEILNYTYDRKDQLLTATNPLRSLAQETFTYDITGNLLRKQGQNQDSVYNTNNQLTEDEVYIYKYDIKGNMVERKHKTNNTITRYEWDIENQLTKVTTHETETAMPNKTITYAYDALGRRIEKNINGKIKRYIYDNEDIILEFNGEGLLKKTYVHGLGVDEPLVMEYRPYPYSVERYYYHKDGMGSITSLTDKDGNEVEKYLYNAFGKMTIYDETDNKIEVSQFDNPYSFTGREHDSETSLHYHRARYYDPELARWISEDPIEFNSGDMNLYKYVLNSPVNYFDQNGEAAIQVLATYIVYTASCNIIKSVRFAKTYKKIFSEEKKKILKKIKKLEKELEMCATEKEESRKEQEILELKLEILTKLQTDVKEMVKGSLVDHFIIDTACFLAPTVF